MAEPLDLSRPLELDDGTPVVLTSIQGASGFYATTPKYSRHNENTGQDTWFYDIDGTWGGGNRKHYYYIRNAGPVVPEEYEGWFVA